MYVILSNEEYESLMQTPGKGSLFMESAVKNNNNILAYENVNLIKAYIMLLIEIEENKYDNSQSL